MTPILVLIAAATLYWYWSAGRNAAELATRMGRNACEAAGATLLDESVHQTGLKLRRGEDGKLGFERAFRFEYSHYGTDRNPGKLVLHGDKLVSFSGPVSSNVVPFEKLH